MNEAAKSKSIVWSFASLSSRWQPNKLLMNVALLGPDTTIEQLQVLSFQIHEAPCYIPEKSQLFFVEWGAPGGENSEHDYPYLLVLKTSNLTTMDRTTILNKHEEQPFIGLNDLDMDREGNYYMRKSLSGWGQYLHPCGAPTAPTVYFVNTT
ncbi:uncharacterized protein PG986_005737 [Apiospora aurea]|uniref:Uncharacterized protein n=1 Tax=Apiospora aurea TaxID=335848 RepID=A0ABR1QIM0_9PEZI